VRFTVTPDWRDNRLLKLVLGWFLGYVALFWVTNGLLYFGKMGLTPASIVAYYRGDEARFLTPRSYQGMLEISHFHLFAMGILILTMTHLLLFVPMAKSRKAWIVSLSFAAAVGDEAAGWLVRFVAPAFAYLKIAAFLTLQTTLAFMVVAVAWALLTAQPNSYRDDEDKEDGER
jgi:Kef-type K+ transport system membrane component KefB